MPPRQEMRTAWCFTLNNPTPEDVERLSSPIDGVSYLIFGKETGESGTPHLQGLVIFQSRKRLSSAVRIIGQAHFSPTRSVSASIEYCSKDGDVTTWGEPPGPDTFQGQRTDLEKFKESVKAGEYDHKILRELHSTVYAAHRNFCRDYVDDNKPRISVEAHPLREWQSDLYEVLTHAPDKREIIFIVDATGNSGKSWFARYYTDLHDNAQIVIPSKKADMAYVIEEDKKVFFFDCPRSKQGDFIQYDFLEELKNGLIFSPKYESKVKKLATPHVVVLMNERPDMTKLSRDRYQVTTLTD